MRDARCDCRSGLVSMRSGRSVDDTVSRVRQLIECKGIRVFATIDHAAEAKRVGMSMPATVVLLFGDPRAGTPLMVAAPTIAIDLPLKVLIADDGEGAVWISYVAPDCMKARHGVSSPLAAPLDGLEALVARAVGSDEESQGH